VINLPVILRGDKVGFVRLTEIKAKTEPYVILSYLLYLNAEPLDTKPTVVCV
jgi:hypothetical protein